MLLQNHKLVLMLVSLVVIVASIDTAFVIAYDFGDSDYNEFLMKDLIDVTIDDDDWRDEKAANVGPRNKRDTLTEASSELAGIADDEAENNACKTSSLKRHNGYFRCCNDETDSDGLFEQYRDVKKQCLRDYRANQTIRASDDWFSCSRINRTIEEAICVSQCVAQRIGIVDADGNLVPDAVRNYTQQLSQAGWQRAAAANVSDTCLAEDANATATPTTGNGCNMAALRLSYCLWREFTRACPRELQSRSKRCLLLRDRLVNGENLELQAYQSFRLHPLADHKAQPQPEQHQRPEVSNVASRMLMGLA